MVYLVFKKIQWHSMIEAYTLEGYKQFIEERRKIYVKKEIQKLPPPYTENEILRTEKFCNIDRENDHQTKLFRKSIEKRNKDYSVLSSFIFRFGKSTSSLCKAFKEIEDFKILIEYIRSPEFVFSYEGKRISLPPYRTPIVDNYRKQNEDLGLGNIKWLFKQIYKQREEILEYFYTKNPQSKTPMEMVHELSELIDTPRKLPFYYHQIVADLSVTIPENVDPEGFTYMALGARKGIEGIRKKEGWGDFGIKKEDIWYLYQESCKIKEYVQESFFTIEHSLCEYNKYSEYVTGVRKRKYSFEKTRDKQRDESLYK